MPNLFRPFFSISTLIVLAFSTSIASLLTVVDSKGNFTLTNIPARIIALEYSFVDALVAVGISPIGIADDKDSNRVMPELRKQIGRWTSVGMRSQPNLEVIASLKPDLIIADTNRHSSIYKELNKIAPTLLLPSRGESYEANLLSAAKIGTAVGKNDEVQARIKEHNILMDQFAAQLKPLHNKTIQFAVAREKGLYLHSGLSYGGGLIERLGLKLPKYSGYSASYHVSLEMLFGLNPDFLLIGEYVDNNITKKWETGTLWKELAAVKNNRIVKVDGNTWARCRGIIAAEVMARDLLSLLSR